MRLLVFLFFFIPNSPLLAQGNNQVANVCLRGVINGLPTGVLTISYRDYKKEWVSNTLNVVSDTFVYKTYIPEPVFATITLYNDSSVNIFIEPGEIKFITSLKAFSSYNLFGSQSNYDMLSFLSYRTLNISKGNSYIYEESKVNFDFISKNPNSFYSLYLFSFDISDLPYEKAIEIYNSFSENVKNTETGKIVFEKIKRLKKGLSVASVKNIFLLNDNNKKIRMQDLFKENEYILVCFWASWCKPCREDVSYEKDIYKKYKEKKMTILAVSDDEDKVKWLKAITEDGTNGWFNIIDIDKKVQQIFGINGLPTRVLINNKFEVVGRYSGTIFGKDALNKKLNTLF